MSEQDTTKSAAASQHVHDHGHDHTGHVHGPSCTHGHDHHHHGPQAPLVRASPKIGRNDPCLCGSGKKYKTCCGA